MVTDPIADMLTRIRNAGKAKHSYVMIPGSKIKAEIVRVLKEQGYIKNFEIIPNDTGNDLKVQLKYFGNSGNSDYDIGKHTIIEIERVSKLGRRVYSKSKDIKPVYNGLGIAIISTSKGIKTDKEAREQNLGGEILCHVW